MTPRENAMAILRGEQPDYYFDMMDCIEILPDPDLIRNWSPDDGKIHPDAWGTLYIHPPGAPGAHPVVTNETAVIKDIEKWEEQIRVPTLEGLDFEPAKKAAAAVDRKERFVGVMMGGGLFERTHHLQGMENALVNYLEYPEETKGLLACILNYKLRYIDLVYKELHPDVIFYHDDWGFKRNLFLPVPVWREFIKPLQKQISDRIHSHCMMYIHHADCYCEPLVEDMIELGIDVWQGVIPENDIVGIQERTQHRLPMIGGIDIPAIDIDNISEEAIRREIRRAYDTYCPGGKFFPGGPGGGCYISRNEEIAQDEAAKYGREFAQKHPVVNGKIQMC